MIRESLPIVEQPTAQRIFDLFQVPVERICKNCKWWKKHEFGNAGDCKSGKIVHPGGATTELLDDEVFAESFHPGPSFGCPHWREKDVAPDTDSLEDSPWGTGARRGAVVK